MHGQFCTHQAKICSPISWVTNNPPALGLPIQGKEVKHSKPFSLMSSGKKKWQMVPDLKKSQAHQLKMEQTNSTPRIF